MSFSQKSKLLIFIIPNKKLTSKLVVVVVVVVVVVFNSIFIQGHNVQFSRAEFKWSPDTTQKQRHQNIKTRQLIKLQRQHVPQALLLKMAL